MAEPTHDISMNGYVRKINGRSTKGGSLPASARALSADRTGQPADIDLRRHRNGNGAARANGTNGSTVSEDPAGDIAVHRFLNEVVLGLWSAERSEASHQPAIDSRAIPERFPLWKRALDISFILLTLPFWLPIITLLMTWVKLASPGPIFYRQRRVGYRGAEFMIFKVRTMHMNAETHMHEQHFEELMRSNRPMRKLDSAGDPRLIPGGRFIRSSGLDELPQLFNVLFGEMTLVGPRPCLPNEYAGFLPEQRKRVNVPPGLTGYWQVNGKNNVTFREMIAMDLFYAEKMSLWLDLVIIARTLPVLISEAMASRQTARLARPVLSPAPTALEKTA